MAAQLGLDAQLTSGALLAKLETIYRTGYGDDFVAIVSGIEYTFSDLKHQMNRVSPLNGEGSICASVRKMSVDEAAESAALVVSLYGEISRLGDSGQVMLPLDGQEPRVVPPFLVKTN